MATPTHPRTSVRWRLALAVLLSLGLFATACRVETVIDGDALAQSQAGQDESATAAPGQSRVPGTPLPSPSSPPADLPRALTASSISCEAPSLERPQSLNSDGATMLARHVSSGAAVPSYALAVDINPETGQVAGAMRSWLPPQDQDLSFRVFAGMEAFNSGLQISNVTVNGDAVDAVLDRALLKVPGPSSTETNVVEMDFTFAIDQMAANENILGSLTGQSLQPDQVGLLGRTDTGMQLGHWFPVWLATGVRTDADPSGFGDIGAFPTANICATITVPSGYDVITGGARTNTSDTSITEAGAGLRDFAILISDEYASASRVVRGVEIRVWGPESDPESIQTVLDFADQSHQALTDAFGPYPWTEIDIISAPLGAGVGGMEWPGAIWIERNMFAGGVAGLGDLGALFGDEDMGDLLGAFGGQAITTGLEWVVAHELGHEWWHATVGNDSIASPAVDEPLAQFAACVAMQRIHPGNWRDICEAQTTDQYAQARSLGVNDTAAEQASDAFESSLQYGAIVYGKAPGFYFVAADLIGWDTMTDALKSFVAENSFALVSTSALRDHLVAAAGDDGLAIAELWDRWFREAKGDEDIEPADLFGLGGLEGLEGLEDLDLDEFLGEGFDFESLFGENADLEELLGEDFDLESLFGEDADLEELLGDNPLFEGLLEDLLEATEGGN